MTTEKGNANMSGTMVIAGRFSDRNGRFLRSQEMICAFRLAIPWCTLADKYFKYFIFDSVWGFPYMWSFRTQFIWLNSPSLRSHLSAHFHHTPVCLISTTRQCVPISTTPFGIQCVPAIFVILFSLSSRAFFPFLDTEASFTFPVLTIFFILNIDMRISG